MEKKSQEFSGPTDEFAALIGILNESKQWAKQILARHRKDLEALRHQLGIDDSKLSDEDDSRLMRKILDLRNNAQTLDEQDKWTVIFSAATSVETLVSFKPDLGCEPGNLMALYLLGCAHGAVGDLDHWPTKLYENYFHSKKSQRAVSGRWAKRDSLLEEIRSEADRRWRDGSTDFHHDMANKLEKHFRHRSPQISVRVIRRAILPTAKAYGRARGVKK